MTAICFTFFFLLCNAPALRKLCCNRAQEWGCKLGRNFSLLCPACAHWVMVRPLGRARISLRLSCKKSEEREGRRTGKGSLRKGCESGQQKWLREVRGSWALEVVDKNLSLQGNTNIVL